MAYDETVAARLREGFIGVPHVVEKKMFGGLAFLVGGHMCCGVLGDDLMVRVGPDAYEKALAQPHARKMDFTGKPMKGFVYVGPAGFREEGALRAWIDRGLSFVTSLPPK
jgi:hypothetical protein